MAVATSTSGPVTPDELLPALARRDRPAAREVPPRHRPLRPGGHDPGAGRRAIALERADAPQPAGRGPRPTQAPPGPPRPGARRRVARCPVPPRGPRRRADRLEQRDGPRGDGPGQSRGRRRDGLGGGRVTQPRGAQDHALAEAQVGLGGPVGGRCRGDRGRDIRRQFDRRAGAAGPIAQAHRIPAGAEEGTFQARGRGPETRVDRWPGPRLGWQAVAGGEDLRPT